MLKNIIIAILFGCFLIYFGFNVLITGLFDAYYGYMIKLGIFKYPISIFFIFMGLFIFYRAYQEFLNPSPIYPSHTICPKCKQTFNYTDLKDGKCPTCDIDTIEIEQYYKDNPPKEKR